MYIAPVFSPVNSEGFADAPAPEKRLDLDKSIFAVGDRDVVGVDDWLVSMWGGRWREIMMPSSDIRRARSHTFSSSRTFPGQSYEKSAFMASPAIFQGWGWPPCTKIMTTWYSHNERGVWWVLCNTSHNVGGFIIPLLAAYLATTYTWRTGMIVPGIIGLGVGVLICVLLRDKPESIGLPKVGEWREDALEQEQVKTSDASLRTWQVLRQYVFTNKYIWLVAMSYVLVYVVRIGMNDWTNIFLHEERGIELIVANSTISMFELGGFIGTIVAGWESDPLFRGNRAPMNVIFMMGITACILVL